MDIEYTTTGKFVTETSELCDELDADGIIMFVFGSKTKGSGCCCEMRVSDPTRLTLAIIECMREMADAMERDVKNNRIPRDGDYNGHE